VIDLDLLKSQKLFPARKLGDALIVEPKGALGGYGRTVIDGDVKGILTAVTDLGVRVVILNLGSWNYFGSEMIGMFFQLRRSIPEDVKVVICDASRDMQTILETMNVHQVIPIYATQKEALSEAAHVSMRDRLPSRRYLIPISIVAVLLAVVVVGVLFAGI
jgi:anti-anti-sigma regulatory factor